MTTIDSIRCSCRIVDAGTSRSTATGGTREWVPIDQAITAATASKDFGLRFVYFAFACLLYSIWRAVDLLVHVELIGEYEHSPIVTADNTLTLLKKEPGGTFGLGQRRFPSGNTVENPGKTTIWV